MATCIRARRVERACDGFDVALPVTVSAPGAAADTPDQVDAKEPPAAGGSIHIEIPGRAMISVERGADASLLSSILESLRK